VPPQHCGRRPAELPGSCQRTVIAQSTGMAAPSRDVSTGWNCLWLKMIHGMDRTVCLADRMPGVQVQSPDVTMLLPTSVVGRADTSVLHSDIRGLMQGRAVQSRGLCARCRIG